MLIPHLIYRIILLQSSRRRGHGRQRKNDRFLRFKDDQRTIGLDEVAAINADSKSNSHQNMVSIFQSIHCTKSSTKIGSLFGQDLPYFDCIATGWGKSTSNENLTDTLFKTRVLIVDNQR